jgi:glycosyltransferase involved in cell wall biosynthesis
MRVIFNTSPLLLQKTGIGYYIHNLYKGLLQSDEVDVYPTVDAYSLRTIGFMSKQAQLLRRLFGDRVLKISVPVGNFLTSKAERKNKTPEADIYHEANYDIIPSGSWKSVANIHDLAFLRYPEYVPEQVLLKCRANFKNILSADRFIVNTHAIKNECVSFENIPDERIDVIPHAPSGAYHPVNRDKKEGKKNVDKYTKSDYILYVGTIEPRKNLPVLLKAFKTLRSKYPLKLIMAGGMGWSYEDILKMPYELGMKDDIIFTGYIDEKTVMSLYNYASAVVYPSTYEGFGMPVIEAMSCGVPVIVSDIPSLSEISGGAAAVFNKDDHEQLASVIEDIISSDTLRSDMIRKGLDRSSKYSWDRTVSLTIETYRKTMGI